MKINLCMGNSKTKLIDNIKNLRLDDALELIDKGCSLNELDKHGRTALSWAIHLTKSDNEVAAKKAMKIIDKLLEAKCDVNLGTPRHKPIHDCVNVFPNICSAEVTQKLIKAKADINVLDDRGYTPFERILNVGSDDLVIDHAKLFIDAGCKLFYQNIPALFCAVYHMNDKRAELILNKHLKEKDFNMIIEQKFLILRQTHGLILNDSDVTYNKIPSKKIFICDNETLLDFARRQRVRKLCFKIKEYFRMIHQWPEWSKYSLFDHVPSKTMIKKLRDVYKSIYTNEVNNLLNEKTNLISERIKINNGDVKVFEIVIEYLL